MFKISTVTNFGTLPLPAPAALQPVVNNSPPAKDKGTSKNKNFSKAFTDCAIRYFKVQLFYHLHNKL